jgi:hypothetical protein
VRQSLAYPARNAQKVSVSPQLGVSKQWTSKKDVNASLERMATGPDNVLIQQSTRGYARSAMRKTELQKVIPIAPQMRNIV